MLTTHITIRVVKKLQINACPASEGIWQHFPAPDHLGITYLCFVVWSRSPPRHGL